MKVKNKNQNQNQNIKKFTSPQRKNFSNNKDFYSYCSKMFAKAYIPLMIQEYKITDDKVLNTLMNIANGDGIKIFEPGEAKEYVNSKGKEFNGSGDAFRFEDSICFTPDLNKDEKLSEEMKSIVNANRMLGMMIHETTHILYDVTKYEHFNYSNLSELTSGGSVLNEGIVEMHALDFAKKYNLPTLPSIMYMNVVEMARTLKEMHGPEKFEELCLSGTYEDLVPSELLEKFKTNERIRYFSKDGYKVDPSLINLSEEKSREL